MTGWPNALAPLARKEGQPHTAQPLGQRSASLTSATAASTAAGSRYPGGAPTQYAIARAFPSSRYVALT